jgi:hypothetical protein
MKKIVSFGDSFVFGNELQNNRDGSRAWPALAAHDLGCAYETMAVAGCGNENIARQIYTYFSNNPPNDTLAVINWTWCMRWDFFLQEANSWITLGPTCVPGKLQDLIGLDKAAGLIDFYRTRLEPSHSWNVFRSLQCIYAVQSWLKQRGIKNVQTYMDHELFKPNPNRSRLEHYQAYRDPAWPIVTSKQELDTLPDAIQQEVKENYQLSQVPGYIQNLQNLTLPEMSDFEGTDFLTWSRDRGYPITPTPGDHPLELAHAHAAQLWKPIYASKLGIVL